MAIIILAIAFTGFFAFSVYIKPRHAAQVLIQGESQNWIFPLDAEETIAVRGPLGRTVVRIHNGQAWVESSPCENKICVAAGHLSGHGEFAACLPNKVLLMIEGRFLQTPWERGLPARKSLNNADRMSALPGGLDNYINPRRLTLQNAWQSCFHFRPPG